MGMRDVCSVRFEVWIDGEYERLPLVLRSSHWIVFGLNAYDGRQAAVMVGDSDADPRVHDVHLLRIAAWRNPFPDRTLEDHLAEPDWNAKVVTIHWADGTKQEIKQPKIDQLHVVHQKS